MTGKPIDEAVLDRACEAYAEIAGDYMGFVRRRAMREALIAAQQGQAVAECHCATCTCAPGMTPAMRFDTSPAAHEGAVRDHLIALGWTPPGAQQPAAVDEAMVMRAAAAVMSAPPGISVEAYVRIVLEAALAAQRQEPKS